MSQKRAQKAWGCLGEKSIQGDGIGGWENWHWWRCGGWARDQPSSWGIALNHRMRLWKVSVLSSACHSMQRLGKSPHSTLWMGREIVRINCTFNVFEQKEYIIVWHHPRSPGGFQDADNLCIARTTGWQDHACQSHLFHRKPLGGKRKAGEWGQVLERKQ